MTKEQWRDFTHFKENENWGEPDRIDYNLVFWLEVLRKTIGHGIIITCGTQGKHAPQSYHYKGQAADIVIPSLSRSHLPDVFWTALHLPFNGVGIYPDWEYYGEKVGGLHLDIRHGKKVTWLKSEKGAYDYNVSIKKIISHFNIGSDATCVYLANSPHYPTPEQGKLRRY